MDRRERRRRADYEDAVEYLCVNFASLGETIGGTRWQGGIAALQSAEPHTVPWYDAVRLLHELAEDADIPGGLGLTSSMGTGSWPGNPVPRSTGWVCPGRHCPRVHRFDREADPSPREPECQLSGRPMRFVAG